MALMTTILSKLRKNHLSLNFITLVTFQKLLRNKAAFCNQFFPGYSEIKQYNLES
jgi:hypothetical protein